MGKNTHLTEEKETIVIENTDNVIGWLEKFLKLLKEYGPIKILVSAFLIACVLQQNILYLFLSI